MALIFPSEMKDFLKTLEPGALFFDVIEDEYSNKYPAFIFKEEKEIINSIKAPISFKTVIIAEEVLNVLISDVMIQFLDVKDNIYETIINLKNPHGQSFLDELSIKDYFHLCLFDEDLNQRWIKVPNNIKKEAIRLSFLSKEWLDWSTDDFFMAKERFFNNHKSLKELFETHM